MPDLDVIRPADANEVAEAWKIALNRTHCPVAMVMTRQNVPVFDRSKYASAEGVQRGGYVLADPEDGDPELILIATGSEVQLAVGAHEQLTRTRSAPASSASPAGRSSKSRTSPTATRCCRRGSPPGWRSRRPRRSAGSDGSGTEGAIMGMTTFGQSAPFSDVEAEFGFTVDNVVKVAREVAGRTAKPTT